MQPFTTLTAVATPFPLRNCDTDVIIPARFLKRPTRTGMGEGTFYTVRFNDDGSEKPEAVFNQPRYRTAQILLAGDNFGCGSSREHAPWALQGYGFKAVISTYFADIFRNNALKNGLLPIQVDQETYYQLASLFEEDPSATVAVDLASQQVTLPGGQKVGFPVEPFAKHCLLNGVDQLGFLMTEDPKIAAYEQSHAARVDTLS